MSDQFYIETINRFVVEYHEELPDAHKAQMRLNGVDPDNRWDLKWSFTTLEAAEEQLAADRNWYAGFCEKHDYQPTKTFRVRDLGAPVEVNRQIMF